MKAKLFIAVLLMAPSTFANTVYHCKKWDAKNNIISEDIVAYADNQPIGSENSNPVSSKDGSYDISHNFAKNLVTVVLRISSAGRDYQSAASGDANIGVRLIIDAREDTVGVECKLIKTRSH